MKQQLTGTCEHCEKVFVIKDHPNRPRTYCSLKCRAEDQPKKNRMATCHPDRPHRSLGLCKQCWSFADTIKRTYNLTPAQWYKMYDLQKGKCPICQHNLYKPGNKEGNRAADVDHDHSSKKVRGLTCWRCNRYKICKNNLESARRLVTYLERDIDGRTL